MRVFTMGLCGVMALVGAMLCTGCSESKKSKAEMNTIRVDTTKKTATVQSIDYNNRLLTLQLPNGDVRTYKISQNVTNFNQIKPNDRITVTLVESVAVAIMPSGSPEPARDNINTVTLAPRGAKPGMVMTNTTMRTAKITAIDNWNRKVTLQTPNGKEQVVKVAPQVDLGQFKKGDDVMVRETDNMAISVDEP